MLIYTGINKKRERLCKEQGIDETRRDEFSDLGDNSPLFRCVLIRYCFLRVLNAFFVLLGTLYDTFVTFMNSTNLL